MSTGDTLEPGQGLLGPSGAGDEHRQARCHRLDHRHPEGLELAQVHQQVVRVHLLDHLLVRHRAAACDALGDAELD